MFICVGNFNFLTEFSITEINQLRFRVILDWHTISFCIWFYEAYKLNELSHFGLTEEIMRHSNWKSPKLRNPTSQKLVQILLACKTRYKTHD